MSTADEPAAGTTQTRAAAPVRPFCDDDQQPIQACQRGSAWGVCALTTPDATIHAAIMQVTAVCTVACTAARRRRPASERPSAVSTRWLSTLVAMAHSSISNRNAGGDREAREIDGI